MKGVYISYQKFRTFQMSDKVFSKIKMSEIFYVRTLEASEIFRELNLLLIYFTKHIISFLDQIILSFSLLSTTDFAGFGRNIFKRGMERLCFLIEAANAKIWEKSGI